MQILERGDAMEIEQIEQEVVQMEENSSDRANPKTTSTTTSTGARGGSKR